MNDELHFSLGGGLAFGRGGEVVRLCVILAIRVRMCQNECTNAANVDSDNRWHYLWTFTRKFGLRPKILAYGVKIAKRTVVTVRKKQCVAFTVFHSPSSTSEPEPRFSLLLVLCMYLLWLLIWPHVWRQRFLISGTLCCRETWGAGGHFWMFTLSLHMRVLPGPCSPSLTGQFYLSIYLFKWLLDNLFSKLAAGLAASRHDGTSVGLHVSLLQWDFFFFFLSAID